MVVYEQIRSDCDNNPAPSSLSVDIYSSWPRTNACPEAAEYFFFLSTLYECQVLNGYLVYSYAGIQPEHELTDRKSRSEITHVWRQKKRSKNPDILVFFFVVICRLQTQGSVIMLLTFLLMLSLLKVAYSYAIKFLLGRKCMHQEPDS